MFNKSISKTSDIVYFAGQKDVYVELEKLKRTFRAVMTDCKSLQDPRDGENDDIIVIYNPVAKLACIEMICSPDNIAAKEQLVAFQALLFRLNHSNLENNFHIERVNFFSRQAKLFVNVTLDPSSNYKNSHGTRSVFGL
jgi:hypothetical protein